MTNRCLLAGLSVAAILGTAFYLGKPPREKAAALSESGEARAPLTPAILLPEVVKPAVPSLSIPDGFPPKLGLWVAGLRMSPHDYEKQLAELYALAWTDFPKAVAMLDQPRFKNESLAMLFSMVHNERLEGFGEDLEFIPDGQQRITIMQSVAQDWTKRDAQGLANYASSHLTGMAKNTMLAAAASGLAAARQFEQAEAVVNGMPLSSSRTDAFNNLAARWAAKDSVAALNWAARLAIPQDRDQVERRIVGSGALTMDQLVAFMNKTTNDQSRLSAVNVIANRLVESDLKAATEWAAQVPEEYRARIQGKIAVKLAKSDATQGTERAVAIADPSVRISSIDAITQDMIAKSPQSTARWLETLPADLHEREAFVTANSWYRIDAIQAAQWVDSLATGKLKDRALVGLSSAMNNSDKGGARAAAGKISDPKLRAIMLETYGGGIVE